jgi:hypothetical protein
MATGNFSCKFYRKRFIDLKIQSDTMNMKQEIVGTNGKELIVTECHCTWYIIKDN